MLVTDEGICCLADFGFTSIFDSQQVVTSRGLQGSICWLAPELMGPELMESELMGPELMEPELMKPFCPSVHNAKAGDIYALACTIYEAGIGCSI